MLACSSHHGDKVSEKVASGPYFEHMALDKWCIHPDAVVVFEGASLCGPCYIATLNEGVGAEYWVRVKASA